MQGVFFESRVSPSFLFLLIFLSSASFDLFLPIPSSLHEWKERDAEVQLVMNASSNEFHMLTWFGPERRSGFYHEDELETNVQYCLC